jgi:N-terminal acetyltransferase B complex non-catalytic subunit
MPPDELILLTVQRLLYSGPGCSIADATLQHRLVAAALLEAAIDYSPHNFKLKLAAIQLYAKGLQSSFRAWTLYQDLFLKHIQHETCSHVILLHLISSGLFDEAFNVCRSIQDFHIKSYRELQEGIQRAMECHHVGKAHEFMQFHTTKLQPSLVLREAKGLTLNLSPLLSNTRVSESGSSGNKTGELGNCHGIVGGTSDMNRTADMISEVHNPTGSFDVLRVLNPSANVNEYVDNRDNVIKTFDILGSIYAGDGSMEPSIEWIWENTVRRSLQHSLLIRATLCADGSKGLKKGRLVKCDPSQSRRCESFRAKILQAIESQHKFVDKGCLLSLSATIDLCRSILSLSGGSYDGDQSLDEIESREKTTLLYLERSAISLKTVPDELKNECGVESASLYLLDYFLQLFVLTRIATSVAETFGWGKKKRKTKPVSSVLAEIARSLVVIGDQLQSNIEKRYAKRRSMGPQPDEMDHFV